MTQIISENYVEKLVDTVAKTLVEAFENLTIEDVNMYQIGYNKGICDFTEKLTSRLTDAIHQKDVKSMTNLINDVAKEFREVGVDND